MPDQAYQQRQADAIANPFAPAVTRISEYTAQEVATLQSRLDKQLGPEYISTRSGPGGTKLSYLGIEKAITLANEVFGFNGWSSEVRNVQIDFVSEKEGKVSLSVSVVCRVTLRDGTFHEDLGTGTIENCKSKAMAFEKVKKEAVSDALKRTLRNFGSVLGTCLYDKDFLSRISKVKAEPSRWDPANLYRQPDYAPVKSEPTSGSDRIAPATMSRKPISRREMSGADDEFGGDAFDEMDFDHAEGIEMHDDSFGEAMAETPRTDAKSIAQQPLQRPPINKTQSMPPIRPPNQQPQVQNNRPAPPAHNTSMQQNQRPPYQPQANKPHASTPENPALNGPAAHQTPTENMPQVGFVTSRAAEAVQNPGSANGLAHAMSNAPAFNPHADSPSLRRTGGVAHTSSRPIRREDLQTIRQQGVQGQPQPQVDPPRALQNGAAGLAAGGVAAANGPSRPVGNFVNPQNDVNRRIGMPANMGAPSPMSNRGSYKMPGPAPGANGLKRGPPEAIARPPLADVGNTVNAVSAVGDGLDAKKVKVAAGT